MITNVEHVELNISIATVFLTTQISKKRELQQIAFNHSADIDFKEFTNF